MDPMATHRHSSIASHPSSTSPATSPVRIASRNSTTTYGSTSPQKVQGAAQVGFGYMSSLSGSDRYRSFSASDSSTMAQVKEQNKPDEVDDLLDVISGGIGFEPDEV